jgi:hypothetical protein
MFLGWEGSTRLRRFSSFVLIICTLALLSITAGPARAAGSIGNLLQNPGAEAGPGGTDSSGMMPPPDWTVTGDFTVVQYGAAGGFPTQAVGASIDGGANFFAGGNSAASTATQAVDVSGFAGAIDAGTEAGTLSGDLGGYDSQDDNMVVTATYLSASGSPLASLTIGPVTAADRDDQTTLLPRSATGPVPTGTRSIQVVMTSTRFQGDYDDGYGDNISLTLATSSPPSAVTGSPAVTGSTGAAFSGSVNPNGLATTVSFQYGLDPSLEGSTGPVVYTQSTSAQQIGSGFTNQAVSTSVSGLLSNAEYHVRIVAANSAGTTDGPDQTFTTPKGPAPPPPVLGKLVNVKPVAGIVLIKLPGGYAADLAAGAALAKGQGFIPLTEARQLPTGTQVDSRKGTIQLVAASASHGKTQTGNFGGALFGIAQDRTGLTKGLTVISLLEGAFPGAPTYASCPKAAPDGATARAARVSPKVLQTLHASDNHGKFGTKGRYSSATVRGTVWTIGDRCNGTFTRVQRGTVVITDFANRKTITLHAGQSFLASAVTKKRR